MDPLEWQQLADRIAADLGTEIGALEAEFWPDAPHGSFRSFWPRVKVLNERVRTAPAIKLDDKLSLQKRLNELCQRARQEQRQRQEARAAQERDLLDALAVVNEEIADASTVEETNQIRANLAVLREGFTQGKAAGGHPADQRIWQVWQEANQAAWNRLNELWAANEQELERYLTEAEDHLQSGSARESKEAIKRFHEAARTLECSHRALRDLRARAGQLWRHADEVGKEKHARYLENAARRLEHWKSVSARRQHARVQIERDIAALERQMAGASTDVGAALLRGQLEERRRALAEIDAADRDLRKRIDEAEGALERS